MLLKKQVKRFKMADLVKFKKEKKSKNPDFIRQDHHKKKKLAKLWRKPRGIDSKKRLMKNNRVIVKPGYGTPDELRGYDKEGRKIIYIESIKDISKIDPKKQVAVIARKIGFKKKIEMLKEVKKSEIVLLNIRDIDAYIKRHQEKRKAKKKQKKEEPKKETKKKEEKSIEDKLSEEEKKKLEKKEIDKLLTKKF